MMRFLLDAFFILLGIHIVTANQICPNDLSANCDCTSQSNDAFVSCLYPDPSNITKILSTQAGQLQPSWIILYFGIRNNSLTFLPDNYFDGIDMIFRVDISNNQFTSVPEALKRLSTLTEINLSSNQLQSLNIPDLSVFKNLRKLDLSNNKITDVVSTEPGVTMPTLREINLSSNNLTNVDPRALLSFPNLRNLIMSENRHFEAISVLQLPDHISAARFESNRIKSIDVCKFKHLNDLESLNLGDNDLECTCDLFTLFSWVAGNRDDGLVHEVHGEDPTWDCLENGATVNISEFGARRCNATSILLSTSMCAETIPEGFLNVTDFPLPIISELNLNIESAESENIVLAWDLPNTTTLYGFVVIASMVNSDDEPFYTSATLHPDTLSHSLQGSDVKSGNFKVCVRVLLYNETIVGKEDCKTVYIFSSQIIVGILAGVVFIVPFMAILFCIIRLDRQNVRKDRYLHLQEAPDLEAKKIPADLGVNVGKHDDQEKSTTKPTLTFTSSKILPPVTAEVGQPKVVSDSGAESGTDNQSFVDADKIEVKVTTGSSQGKSETSTAHEPQYGAISSHL